MPYETFYWSGGHCGPHQTMKDAILHAMRHLQGVPKDDSVLISARSPQSILEWAREVRVTSDTHQCNCRACESQGQKFYRLHVYKTSSEGCI